MTDHFFVSALEVEALVEHSSNLIKLPKAWVSCKGQNRGSLPLVPQ
jgi:hypothetical protein